MADAGKFLMAATEWTASIRKLKSTRWATIIKEGTARWSLLNSSELPGSFDRYSVSFRCMVDDKTEEIIEEEPSAFEAARWLGELHGTREIVV